MLHNSSPLGEATWHKQNPPAVATTAALLRDDKTAALSVATVFVLPKCLS
jgi:hypothetical protein